MAYNLHVTITDHTKRAKLSWLARATTPTSISGFTVAGGDPKAYANAQFLDIQFDPNSATGTALYIGGKDVDSTHYGKVLLRGQDQGPVFPTAGNTVRFGDIWIAGDADGLVFNVSWMVL